MTRITREKASKGCGGLVVTKEEYWHEDDGEEGKQEKGLIKQTGERRDKSVKKQGSMDEQATERILAQNESVCLRDLIYSSGLALTRRTNYNVCTYAAK